MLPVVLAQFSDVRTLFRIFGAIPSSLIRGSKLLLHCRRSSDSRTAGYFRFLNQRPRAVVEKHTWLAFDLRALGLSNVNGEIPDASLKLIRCGSFTRQDKLVRLCLLAVSGYLLEWLQQSGT